MLAKKLQESALTGQKLLNVKIDQDKDEAIDKIQTLYASGKKNGRYTKLKYLQVNTLI